MKHTLLLILAFMLAVTAAHAQFGVKAGINAAVLDGQDLGATSTKYKTYYHAGVFYEAKLIGPISIQPEVLYSLQGASFKDNFSSYDAKLHYLNVPVLAKVTVGPIFVEAGPQFGVLLRQEADGQISTSASGNGPYSSYKRGDLSLCAGGGLKLGNLLLGGRFNAGVNDINDVRNLSGTNDPRLRNRVIQAYAALQFGK
ncbi:PorT family protein [Hymenobacter taeanensis]|uniref:PorT family protein n=1 Tax=Hymenobacter taeanensis TaxID=2735321 RepID=A0A6M6BEJ6_9BACT|nr:MULTISPECIES: porin family protein [Hymenobacter]QJX46991.1 PorT family protein [Hymenobacter taeanensis]UOQ80867.1 PorT family protein [Hymenobacter sp. 5414T-23]